MKPDMHERRFKNLSLLQLAAVAEDFAWGEIALSESDREALRKTLLARFTQVEALNRARFQRSTINLEEDFSQSADFY